MLLRDSSSLGDRVKDAIIHMIMTEEFENNKLPSESKLAERFGVSVAVVRDALLLLREECVVTKKHGSGNYFNRSALENAARVDQFRGFMKLVEGQGYKATDSVSPARIIKPDERMQRILKLGPEEDIVYCERTIFADGNKAIHCSNYLPRRHFKRQPTEEDLKKSLFTVFEELFLKELAYGQLSFLPYLAKPEDEEKIGIREGCPVILMEEVYYSLGDIPMAFSGNLFNDDYITVSILTR